MKKAMLLAALLALVVTSLASAIPRQVKTLARSTTTQTADSISRTVYLRDDPEYREDLALYQGYLRDAQEELREAIESIAHVGEVTPAMRRAQEKFLRPFRERVARAKADVADVQADYAKPYGAYGFRVSGSQTVTLEWRVSCERGGGDTDASGKVTRRVPFELWRSPTVRGAHSCHVRALASQDRGARMVTSLLGRR